MTNFDKILAAAQKRHGQAQPLKPQESSILLEQIKEREQDTRPLNPKHVESLAESIAVLGLIEPLVLDSQARLLAGGHRLAAIKLLKQGRLTDYEKQFPDDRIPVRTPPFDAEQDPELALQIEVAENEQRRDHTTSEVKAIAERLKSAGYVALKGRPRAGERALMPALAIVVGKHIRTVQRYLDTEDNEMQEKSTTGVALLRPALQKLKQWQKLEPGTATEQKLAKKLPEVLKLIEQILDGE